MARWAIELEEHEIEYKLRSAIKAQVLVDFLAETQEEEEETKYQRMYGSHPKLRCMPDSPFGLWATKTRHDFSHRSMWVEAKPLSSIAGKHVERTSPKQSNEETSFSLTYGIEAVFPVKIIIPTKRTRKVNPTQNKKDLGMYLELLEERREITTIKEAAYKKKLEKYCNKKVRPSVYKPRDYVLRLNNAGKVKYTGNMGPTWEGPYKILEADRNGACVLSTLKGRVIQRTWNGVNLQKYYM
ncbi:hypothetical protein Tco_1143845 [Tanacetum coccineum]